MDDSTGVDKVPERFLTGVRELLSSQDPPQTARWPTRRLGLLAVAGLVALLSIWPSDLALRLPLALLACVVAVLAFWSTANKDRSPGPDSQRVEQHASELWHLVTQLRPDSGDNSDSPTDEHTWPIQPVVDTEPEPAAPSDEDEPPLAPDVVDLLQWVLSLDASDLQQVDLLARATQSLLAKNQYEVVRLEETETASALFESIDGSEPGRASSEVRPAILRNGFVVAKGLVEEGRASV